MRVLRQTTDTAMHTFVQNQQFALSHNSSRQSHNLPLPHRQISTPTSDLAVQCKLERLVLTLEREKADRAQGVVQCGVLVLSKGI